MPFTLFAHQAPVLPVKMRWPDRFDGLGLMVGSIMPDLWYVTKGWGFGPAGIPMWVDGHPLAVQPQYCIVPGMLLTLLLRRVVMPVVPAALPKAGFLRLRDYRLLALSRYRWWITAYSVALGSLTHLILDAFTHRNGFVVENVPALQNSFVSIGPVDLTAYRFLQVLGHVVGSVFAGYLLLVISRRKLQWSWHGFDGRPPDQRVSGPGVMVVRSILALGVLGGIGYGATRFRWGFGTAFIGWFLVVIASTVVAGLVGRRWFGPVVPPSAPAGSIPAEDSPTPIDPLLK